MQTFPPLLHSRPLISRFDLRVTACEDSSLPRESLHLHLQLQEDAGAGARGEENEGQRKSRKRTAARARRRHTIPTRIATDACRHHAHQAERSSI